MTEPLAGEAATEAEAAHLVEVMKTYPGREGAILPYADRRMVVLRPTDGQTAVIARMTRSERIDDLTKVSNMLDILESLLAERRDQAWLADRLLGGEMGLGGETVEELESGPPSAMGLLRKIAQVFAPPENREERRESAKKARRGAR